MTPQELIIKIQSENGLFILERDSFRVIAPKGMLTPDLQAEIKTHKPEIIAILSRPEIKIWKVTNPGIDCPRCRQQVETWTHPSEDKAWFTCLACGLHKGLSYAAGQWCQDCALKFPIYCGRCAECIQRVMLAPNEPCLMCEGLHFWRHLITKDKPAGFAWHCIGCFEPPVKIAVYELSA